MTLKLAGLGAEPKKIGVLVGLILIAAYFLFSNRNPAEQTAAPVRATNTNAPEPLRTVGRNNNRLAGKNGRGASNNPREFRPTFRTKDIDPSKVDPTLHLALLEKLKTVAVEGGTRSLFDVGNPPAPVELKVKEPAKIEIAKAAPTPATPPAKVEPVTPPEPKAPPIPLKFYGFVNPPKAGIKRAFFLDGEDIVIAGEGDTIKKRYKIVRIGVNSATVEDTQFKSNNQQTLPLEAEVAG